MQNKVRPISNLAEGNIKRFVAIIILIYLPLAYFWPEIFLKSYIFLMILILSALIFFLELNLKEKIVLSITAGTFGLFLFKILPTPFGWFLSLNISLPLVIALGTLATFLIILIEVRLLIFIYEKILRER